MKEVFTTQSEGQMEFEVKERFITNFNKSTIMIGNCNGRELVAKFSAYSWGARREWQGLQKVSAAGIPSAKPIAFILGEKPGIITEYIKGKHLENIPDQSLRYRLGILIREMHERVSIDGNEWTGYRKNDFSYYDKKIDEWKRAHIGGNAIRLLQELSIDIGNSFKLIGPVFTHHDLYDNQVIFNGDNLYLIDFEFWMESHPLDDLSLYLMNTIRTGANEDYFWQLCKGYKDNKTGFTEEQKKVITFLLLFSSCKSLEFYQKNRPSDLKKPEEDHQKTLTLIKKESLWKKL